MSSWKLNTDVSAYDGRGEQHWHAICMSRYPGVVGVAFVARVLALSLPDRGLAEESLDHAVDCADDVNVLKE